MAALGQTSALKSLGLLEKVKYVGGISGGKLRVRVRVRVCVYTVPVTFLICKNSAHILFIFCTYVQWLNDHHSFVLYDVMTGAWATIVISYAQNITNVKNFLGEIIQPEDISMNVLEQMDRTCARRLANSDLAAIVLGLLKEHSALSVAEAWAAAIQIMYLGASFL